MSEANRRVANRNRVLALELRVRVRVRVRIRASVRVRARLCGERGQPPHGQAHQVPCTRIRVTPGRGVLVLELVLGRVRAGGLIVGSIEGQRITTRSPRLVSPCCPPHSD